MAVLLSMSLKRLRLLLLIELVGLLHSTFEVLLDKYVFLVVLRV